MPVEPQSLLESVFPLEISVFLVEHFHHVRIPHPVRNLACVILYNSCWNSLSCKDSMAQLNPLALGILPAPSLLPHDAGSRLSAPCSPQESSISVCPWRPYSSLGTSSSPLATRGASGCGMLSPSTGRSACWPAWLPLCWVSRPYRPREGFLSALPRLERAREPSAGPDPGGGAGVIKA